MILPVDSFTFGDFNSVTQGGFKVISHDVLSPQKRERKIAIPNRSGAYDYGANAYEEREIIIQCNRLTQPSETPRLKLREIAYSLSGKKRLTLWNEPTKYYIGELYESPEIASSYLEAFQQFELTFICSPFAIAETLTTTALANGRNAITYLGTWETDTVFSFTNNNAFAVNTVQITAIKKNLGGLQ